MPADSAISGVVTTTITPTHMLRTRVLVVRDNGPQL